LKKGVFGFALWVWQQRTDVKTISNTEHRTLNKFEAGILRAVLITVFIFSDCGPPEGISAQANSRQAQIVPAVGFGRLFFVIQFFTCAKS
jgi:hypothetical protein